MDAMTTMARRGNGWRRLELGLEHFGIQEGLQLHGLGDVALQLELALHESLVGLQFSSGDEHEVGILDGHLNLDVLLIVVVDAGRGGLGVDGPLLDGSILAIDDDTEGGGDLLDELGLLKKKIKKEEGETHSSDAFLDLVEDDVRLERHSGGGGGGSGLKGNH